MDTYLHGIACSREVNQNPVIMPGLKQRLVVIFWAQNRLRSHVTVASFSGSPRVRTKNFRTGSDGKLGGAWEFLTRLISQHEIQKISWGKIPPDPQLLLTH